MPRFSKLLNDVPRYPFARVGQISREVEKRDGVKVINARIGIPDEEAPPTVIRRMSEYVREGRSTYGYPIDVHPERGIDPLVDCIIRHYWERYGVQLEPENVAVTGYTKPVLHNLARMFHGQGTVFEPVYPAYEAAIVLSGNPLQRVPTFESNGWQPDIKFTDMDTFFYFCDPNNPTGAVAGYNYYRELAQNMEKHGVAGIFDKAYADFVFDDDTKPVSITRFPELMDRGFEVWSFSKHYDFTGIGLGWIVSSKANIDRWLNFSDKFSQGVPLFIQKAGVTALSNPQVREEMGGYMQKLKHRRDVFVKGLNDLGLKCEPPKATPYLWVKVPEGIDDDEDFVLNTVLNLAHVAFMPGSYFGPSGRGYFRATVYLPEPEIHEALGRIKAVL